jgi:chorismate mutase
MSEVLNAARAEIDAADMEILGAVNRRIALVRTLHEHKVANDLPLRDPGREESMLADLRAANNGPLSSEGVDGLFRFVLDLTRKEIHGE